MTKKCLFLVTLLVLLTRVAAEESSLRHAMEIHGAQYGYRFASWSDVSRPEEFVVTLLFVAHSPRPDGSYEAFSEGVPLPSAAVILIENKHGNKRTLREERVAAKDAFYRACEIGYAGFFSEDSLDPKQKFFDGSGLIGERILKGVYSTKRRSCVEDLSCQWLFDKLQAYARMKLQDSD